MHGVMMGCNVAINQAHGGGSRCEGWVGKEVLISTDGDKYCEWEQLIEEEGGHILFRHKEERQPK